MVEVTAEDKKRYVLKEERDYQILAKIYHLEKLNLSVNETETLKFVRTQLEDDWRKPLIKYLDELIKKYSA